jgi:hypothetical protein
MPDVVVKITKNGAGCDIDPNPFQVDRNSNVTFEMINEPTVFVDFGDESPFGDATADMKFPPGQKKKVQSNAKGKPFQYKYRVSWPGGQGNGSGEIIP